MKEFLGVAWENIFIGLLGGGIVSLISYSNVFFKNKRLERKFPVSGQYITKFEDEINGEKVTCTAPAILKQKGNKIKGTTTFEDDSRTWILEGEISVEGHIHGIYFAEDPIDKGIGNFFLKVDNKRNMVGLWSGFDSVNNKINSGRYTFKPIRSDIIIKRVESRYIPHLVAIADKQLGEQYLTEGLISSCINDGENYICKVAIDNENEKVAGFYVAYIIESSNIKDILNIESNLIPRILKYPNKIGILKTIAVDDRYQGYSIGTLLSQDSINEFKIKGINTVCTIAWKSENGTNMKGILKHLNFERLVEIDNYWEEDSTIENFKCPVCGLPPCTCSAVIYGLNIL